MADVHGKDRLLTVAEVAERLNVSRASVYLWLKRDFPLPVKLGRASRWNATEVEEWLKKRPKGAYGEGRREGATRRHDEHRDLAGDYTKVIQSDN